MTLTVYTNDFDEKDSISDGFSGDVFIEDKTSGKHFRKNLSSALKYVADNNIHLDEILFCYRDGEEQKFLRIHTDVNTQCPIV